MPAATRRDKPSTARFGDSAFLRWSIGALLMGMLVASVPLAKAVNDSISSATTANESFVTGIAQPGDGATVGSVVGLVARTSQTASTGTFLIMRQDGPEGVQMRGVQDANDFSLWRAQWNAGGFPSGTYTVSFSAVRTDGVTATSAPIKVQLQAGDAATASTATTSKTAGTDEAALAVKITAPLSFASVSGNVALAASTSDIADSMQYVITPANGGGSATVSAPASPSGTAWNGSWASSQYPNGVYSIVARAIRSGVLAVSEPLTVTLANAVSAPSFSISIVAPSAGMSLQGSANFYAETNLSGASLTFFVRNAAGEAVATLTGTANAEGTRWTTPWDTRLVSNGTYGISASGFRDGSKAETEVRTFTVANLVEVTPVRVDVVSPSPSAGLTGTVQLRAQTTADVKALTFIVTQNFGDRASQEVLASGESKNWAGEWPGTGKTAGPYLLIAKVVADGNSYVSAPVSFNLLAPSSTDSATKTPVVADPSGTNVTQVPAVVPGNVVRIEIASPLAGATVKGRVTFSANASSAIEGLTFYIEGPSISKRVNVTASGNVAKTGWNGGWDSATVPDGGYAIKAVGIAGGTETVGGPRTFTVQNAATSAVTIPVAVASAPAQPTAKTPDASTFGVSLTQPSVDQRVGGEVALAATVSGDAKVLRFVIGPMTGGTPTFIDGTFDASSRRWIASWKPGGSAGTYLVGAMAQNAANENAQSAKVRVFVGDAVPTGDAGTKPTSNISTLPPRPANDEGIKVIPPAETVAAVTTPPKQSETITVAPLTKEVNAAKGALDAQCAAAGIGADRCAAWLARPKEGTPDACKSAGIVTKEECAAFLEKKQANPDTIARSTANLMTGGEMTELRDAVLPNIGTSIAAPQLPPAMADHMPLVRKDGGLTLHVQASPGFDQQDDGTSHQTVPALVMVDSDGDGLPDDVEDRLGTNPRNPDTDGDGYSDGTEVAGGYNPLGAGTLGDSEVKLAPVDVAILSGAPMEQPRNAGEESPMLKVTEALTPKDRGESFVLSGTARPGDVVTLFVYSYLPVVFTTTAGDDGNWTYEVDAGLTDGEHQAYATITDDTGKIQAKSSPLSFFVSGAQAVSEEDFFDPTQQSPLSAALVSKPADQLLGLYIGAGAFLVLLALVAAYFLVMRKSSVPPAPPALG